MKIILSRKGFDGNAGGFSSIIYKDNFYSFPIPQTKEKGISYALLNFDGKRQYSTVFENLGIEILGEAHLDPDLKESIYKRETGWKPIFGQAGSAEAHLSNQKVAAGDIFLFFGWFKFSKEVNGKIEYCDDEKYKSGFHAIFGYLQVDDKIDIKEGHKIEDWMRYHPHITNKELYNNKKHNAIYLSRNYFSENEKINGAGLFKFNDSLILTGEKCTKGIWHLDSFFNETTRFEKFKDKIENDKILVSLKGYYPQELMITENDKVVKWATDLICKHAIDNGK